MKNSPNGHDFAAGAIAGASSSGCLSGGANGGKLAEATSLASSSPPPLTPKSAPRACDMNSHPTTFVQADPSSFKQVVQMLTGSAETVAAATTAATAAAAQPKAPAAAAMLPAAKATGPKKPAFKLYERRNSLKNLKMINPLMPTFFCGGGGGAAFSPRNQPDILSPSMLDFPSLILSPVTPLIPDPFNRPPHPNSEAGKWIEDRAIAEKGFYLHPSPRAAAKDAELPRLLTLFPLTSPRSSSNSGMAASPSSP